MPNSDVKDHDPRPPVYVQQFHSGCGNLRYRFDTRIELITRSLT